METDKSLKLAIDVENSDCEAALKLPAEAETNDVSLAKLCEAVLKLVMTLVVTESIKEFDVAASLRLWLTDCHTEVSLAALSETELRLFCALVNADWAAESEADVALATAERLVDTDAA